MTKQIAEDNTYKDLEGIEEIEEEKERKRDKTKDIDQFFAVASQVDGKLKRKCKICP
jgi:hypothetical protein